MMPTLIDGRKVESNSEYWRHECEARHIMALPSTVDRRALLESIEQKRGKPAADRLRATILALWQARKS
jgi:hypothetical protein